MAEFVYSNAKNTSTGHTLFELNSWFYLLVSFKEDLNPYSRSHMANKLADKLKDLIEIFLSESISCIGAIKKNL